LYQQPPLAGQSELPIISIETVNEHDQSRFKVSPARAMPGRNRQGSGIYWLHEQYSLRAPGWGLAKTGWPHTACWACI